MSMLPRVRWKFGTLRWISFRGQGLEAREGDVLILKTKHLAVLLLPVLLAVVGMAGASRAADVVPEASPPPPALQELMEQQTGDEGKPDTMGLQIRGDALREAALSYGARGGLAHRTFEFSGGWRNTT